MTNANARAPWPLLAALSFVVGCGGGAPLLHGVQVIPRNTVTFGAGFSGAVLPLEARGQGDASDRQRIETAAVSPGLAPWVGARLGVGAGYDLGLTYTGRLARFDARRVFPLSPSIDLSLGLGASGVLPRRIDSVGVNVSGFGGDLPLLVGWRSAGDIYAVWLGARGGGEALRGQRDLATSSPVGVDPGVEPVTGWRAYAGGLLGLRVGFRHVHALLELDASMQWVGAELGARHVTLQAFTLAPGGALVARF
ncbi:MAG: hypothetical protein FJ095_05060 [Deltaproteobacteria bacterium]|nr:hypothetical protein [Deltaproteobacteria bacterium]